MQIQDIHYMDETKEMVKVFTEDQGVMFAPYPTQTWHQEHIDAWLEEGNEIKEPEGPSLEDVRSEKIAGIEQGLRDKFSEGMPYTFPGDKEGVVQLGIDDRQNLTALAMRSATLISEGLNDTTMEFRSLSNEVHTLTAEEMNAMANTAMDHVSGLYKQSWDLKDAVRGAKTEEEIKSYNWEE